MLLGISPRGAHAVGVVELRKLLIKHVLSDATDDHVQELAAMQAAPTASDLLERLINEDNWREMGGFVAEDAIKDVHEDVQTHAKRVSRPHKTRSKDRAAPVDHPGSTVEEPHSAGIAPAPEHEIAPAPRATPPRAAVSSGSAPKRLHRGSTLLSKLVSSCPWPSAARYPAIRTRRGR